MTDTDYKNVERITIGCIAGNVVLSVLKLLAGIYGGSKAMVADALHSASDIFATTAVLIGIKIAKKPVDKEHPYGHGKIEPISAAVVGLTLIFAAVMIIKEIVASVVEHSFVTPTFLALTAAVVSIVVKEAMYRITYKAGKEINSEAVMADAWHHRSDALSSIGTLVGISGSMVGNWLGIHILEYLDPLAGITVAGLILKISYDILKGSFKGLMDSSPEEEKINHIRNVVSSIEGVISVPRIKGRYVGRHLHVDMEIEVNSVITVDEGHSIAAEARKKVIELIDDVYEVLVHVEPCVNNI